MSPATTRSTRRLGSNEATRHTIEHQQLQPEPESSDEDDEGIPSRVSPLKATNYDSSGPTLRQWVNRPSSKRQSEDGLLEHLRGSKRRKGIESNPRRSLRSASRLSQSHEKQSYPSPKSLEHAHLAVAAVTSTRPSSSASADEVNPDLLSRLNAAVRSMKHDGEIELPSLLDEQLPLEGQVDHSHEEESSPSDARLDIGDLDVKADPDQIEHLDTDLGVGPEDFHQHSSSAEVVELLGSDEEHEQSERGIEDGGRSTSTYQSNAVQSGQEDDPFNQPKRGLPLLPDPYEVPCSPEPSQTVRKITSGHIKRRGRSRKTKVQNLQRNTVATTGEALEGDVEGASEKVISGQEADEEVACEGEAFEELAEELAEENDEEEGSASEVDFDYQSEIDVAGNFTDGDEDSLNAKQNFRDDVHVFRSRPAKNDEFSETFDAPTPGHSTTIHLSSAAFWRAHSLMRLLGWTGHRRDWEFHFLLRDPSTQVGKVMLHYLKKLERLYRMVPVAPRIAQQDQFLREHKDVLSYYFSMIDHSINFVRNKRLAFARRSDLSRDVDKRKNMAWDLVQLLMPMLIRVLAKVWSLGGERDKETSFTSSTIQLLTRGLGWILKLDETLSKELKKRPLIEEPGEGKEKVYEAETTRAQRCKDIETRERLRGILEEVYEVLAEAPKALGEAEVKATQAVNHRQRSLKKQEDVQILWKREEEERRRAILVRNRQCAATIRGPHPGSPLRQRSSIAPASSPLLATTRASNRQGRPVVWRGEEEACLMKKLLEAYPKLPGLASTALVVGHSEKETVEKSEELLDRVLVFVASNMTGSERLAQVQEVMRQWE